jgi:hypothetical protein
MSSTVYGIVRRLTALLLTTAVVLLTGCQVRSEVRVDVNSNGSGAIAVVAHLDKEAANAVPNLKDELQTSDLVKSGWSVDGPDADGDGKTVTVRHGFDSPDEATALLQRLSGNGPPFVDFRLLQERSLQHVDTTFSGKIDMQQGVSSFGDLGLTQSVGSRLGFDANELEKSLGVNWPMTFPVDVVVHLPGGNVQRIPATDSSGAWHATYGQTTEINAKASGVNARPLVFFGISAAALLASVLVLLFWRSGKYHPRHRSSGGVRARDLLNQK